MDKSTWCSYRGPRSPFPASTSTPAPGTLMPSSSPHGHAHRHVAYTHTDTHTNKNKPFIKMAENFRKKTVTAKVASAGQVGFRTHRPPSRNHWATDGSEGVRPRRL